MDDRQTSEPALPGVDEDVVDLGDDFNHSGALLLGRDLVNEGEEGHKQVQGVRQEHQHDRSPFFNADVPNRSGRRPWPYRTLTASSDASSFMSSIGQYRGLTYPVYHSFQYYCSASAQNR